MRPDISGPEVEPGSFSFNRHTVHFDTVLPDELTMLENLAPAIEQARLIICEGYEDETTAERLLEKYDEPVPKPTALQKLQRIIDGMFMHTYPDLTAEELRDKYLTNVYTNGGGIRTAGIEQSRTGRLKMYNATHTLATVFEHIALQTSEDMYASAKLLARDPGTLTTQTAVQLLLQDYLYIAQETSHAKPYQGLEERVRSGSLDSQIAKEKLHQLLLDDNIGVHDDAMYEAMDMVALHQGLTGLEVDEVVDRLCQPSALLNWPQDAREIIDLSRNELADMLALRAKEKQIVGYQGGYLLNVTTEKDLEQFLLKNAVFRRRLNDNQHRLLTSWDPNAASRSGVKPSKAQRLAQKAVAEVASIDTPEAIKIERKFHFMNAAGDTYEEGSKEFSKMVENYVNAHKGQGLDFSVENALTYLRSVQRVNGKIPGTEQLNGVMFQSPELDAHGKKYQAYRFKPSQAQGVGVSKAGQKMRIVYISNGDDIYIQTIVDRPALISWLRSRGFVGAKK